VYFFSHTPPVSPISLMWVKDHLPLHHLGMVIKLLVLNILAYIIYFDEHNYNKKSFIFTFFFS
jgi:hypothetical protein